MVARFAPLPHVELQPDTAFQRPAELPKIVHLGDPALEVFTDFEAIHPVTAAPQMQIDDALERMKSAGVRLLLVIDEHQHVVGLITAADIQGERPVEIAEQDRVPRAEITVEMLMAPLAQIRVLKLDNVKYAKVGDVVESLRQLQRQHVLVVDVDSATGHQTVCGLFAQSRIDKLMGQGQTESVKTADSLAEVVQERH